MLKFKAVECATKLNSLVKKISSLQMENALQPFSPQQVLSEKVFYTIQLSPENTAKTAYGSYNIKIH